MSSSVVSGRRLPSSVRARWWLLALLAAAVAVAVVVTILAGRSAASSWMVLPTPNAGMRQGMLSATSCTSANACLAVGASNASGANHALAERFDGRGWSIVPTPRAPNGGASALTGVSCGGAHNCVAVGYYMTPSGEARSLVEDWNGTSWSIAASPDPPGATGTSLNSVSCPSATTCTAVGQYYLGPARALTLAERLVGATWTIQTAAEPPGTGALRGVSCASPTACTAVGNYINAAGTSVMLAETWNGASWTLQSLPGVGDSTLVSVSCAAPLSCTAVGQYRDANLAEDLMLTVRSTGATWAVQSTPSPANAINSFLYAIACPTRIGCVATGEYIDSRGVQRPLAATWNGTDWQLESSAGVAALTGGSLVGLSCATRGFCVAVGSYLAANGNYLAASEAWDGSRWRALRSANPVAGIDDSVAAVSCASPESCAAVGSSVDSTANGTPLIEGWNGAGWALGNAVLPAAASSGFLSGVSCDPGGACVAVGEYRDAAGDYLTLAESGDHDRLAVEPTGNPAGAADSSLTGVACPAAGACVAVGSSKPQMGNAFALAETLSGGAWRIAAVPVAARATSASLSDVSCVSIRACTAVGTYSDGAGTYRPLTEHWNGVRWTVQPAPSPPGATLSLLHAVSCATPTSCVGVGWSSSRGGPRRPLAEGWNGARWTVQPTPDSPGTMSRLIGVSCATSLSCTAVGDVTASSGTTATLIEVWNGRIWLAEAGAELDSRSGALSAVSCPRAAGCRAVGDVLRGQSYETLAEQQAGS